MRSGGDAAAGVRDVKCARASERASEQAGTRGLGGQLLLLEPRGLVTGTCHSVELNAVVLSAAFKCFEIQCHNSDAFVANFLRYESSCGPTLPSAGHCGSELLTKLTNLLTTVTLKRWL